jgi:hypothetical protein
MKRISKFVAIALVVMIAMLTVASIASAAKPPASPYNGKWVAVDTDTSNVDVRFKFKNNGTVKVRRFDDGETNCGWLADGSGTNGKSKFRGTGSAVDPAAGPVSVEWTDTRCLPRSIEPTAPFATSYTYTFSAGADPLLTSDDTVTENETGLVFTRAPEDTED